MTHCPHCGEATWTEGRGCEGGRCGTEARIDWLEERIDTMPHGDRRDSLAAEHEELLDQWAATRD